MSGKVVNGQVSPCEKFSCAQSATCKSLEVACSSFAGFVYRGSARAPTAPNRETFEALFQDIDRRTGERGKTHRELAQ